MSVQKEFIGLLSCNINIPSQPPTLCKGDFQLKISAYPAGAADNAGFTQVRVDIGVTEEMLDAGAENKSIAYLRPAVDNLIKIFKANAETIGIQANNYTVPGIERHGNLRFLSNLSPQDVMACLTSIIGNHPGHGISIGDENKLRNAIERMGGTREEPASHSAEESFQRRLAIQRAAAMKDWQKQGLTGPALQRVMAEFNEKHGIKTEATEEKKEPPAIPTDPVTQLVIKIFGSQPSARTLAGMIRSFPEYNASSNKAGHSFAVPTEVITKFAERSLSATSEKLATLFNGLSDIENQVKKERARAAQEDAPAPQTFVAQVAPAAAPKKPSSSMQPAIEQAVRESFGLDKNKKPYSEEVISNAIAKGLELLSTLSKKPKEDRTPVIIHAAFKQLAGELFPDRSNERKDQFARNVLKNIQAVNAARSHGKSEDK